MTVQDLAAKALVHFDGFYFTQIKDERANIYAFWFHGSPRTGKFILCDTARRHDQFIAAFGAK